MPVPVDGCRPILHPLEEDFKIIPWVLYEYLPRLLTIQVVRDVLIDELLWKGLETKICVNFVSKN